MAFSSLPAASTQLGLGEDRQTVHSADHLPTETRECLTEKSLCSLMSMARGSLPERRSALQNALSHCTAVVPYMDPLDALAAANEQSQPTVAVQVPHAKERVYTTVETVEAAHKHLRNCKLAKWGSDIERDIMKGVVAWINSEPEGTEESLVRKLVEQCVDTQYFMNYTVSPSRLFSMNLGRIKHRPAKEQNDAEASKLAEESPAESDSKPKTKFEFAIGIQPGMKYAQQQIEITPKGLTGLEVWSTGKLSVRALFWGNVKYKRDRKRMRAVGQSKGMSEFFKKSLTVAARRHNAVIVPANDQEKNDIIAKVVAWIYSMRQDSSSGGPTDGHMVSAASSLTPAYQTVPKLQQELANKCVGKMRRLAPSTITDLLQISRLISIGGDDKVIYNLPTSRGSKAPFWQQKTVESAVKSCNFSNLMRQAYPRNKRNEYGEKILKSSGHWQLVKEPGQDEPVWKLGHPREDSIGLDPLCNPRFASLMLHDIF